MSCAVLPFSDELERCDRCGATLTGRRTRWCSRECENVGYANHRWTEARHGALTRDGRRCTADGCDTTHSLEVNHIVPRNGGGYGWGCWNHLDNLETLCHAHHLAVTARQRAERRPLFRLSPDQDALDFGESA